MKRLVLPVCVAAVVVACNRGSTPSPALTLPTPAASQTVYTGTITDSVGGSGSLTVSLGSAGSMIGGTWMGTFPGQNGWNRIVTGTVSGNTFTATLADCIETDTSGCFPDCRQAFTGTLTATALAGSYAEVSGDSCATSRSGTVNAVKQ